MDAIALARTGGNFDEWVVLMRQEQIAQAINNTRDVIPGYFEKTIQSRLDGSSCGSFFVGPTAEELEMFIQAANWGEIRVEAPMPGCFYYGTSIPARWSGKVGLIDLTKLPDNTPVRLSDPKGTGKVSAEINVSVHVLPSTDIMTIILGPEAGKLVVYTFHPGRPIQPSQVAADGLSGKTLAASEAIELGFRYAKVST